MTIENQSNFFLDCLDRISIPSKVKQKDYLSSGKYPIISQEADLINGFTNDDSKIFSVDKPVIVFGDHTQVLKYVNFDFVLGADGVKIIKPKKEIFTKFFFYCLKAFMPEKYGYARHYKLLKKLKFKIPSYEIQKKISEKLDKLSENIEKCLNLTKKYENDINRLTTSFFDSQLSKLRKKNVLIEDTEIGSICDLDTGGTPDTSNNANFINGEIPWLVSGDIHKKEIYDCDGRITDLGLKNSNAKYLPLNSVLIALNGQGKTRGTVAILKTQATCNQSLVSIFPKENSKLNSKYLFYFLQSKYQEIRKITGDSGNDRRGLNMKIIRKIKIAFPQDINMQRELTLKFDDVSMHKNLILEKLDSKINEYKILQKKIILNNININFDE